jgi:hypothetical protein
MSIFQFEFDGSPDLCQTMIRVVHGIVGSLLSVRLGLKP